MKCEENNDFPAHVKQSLTLCDTIDCGNYACTKCDGFDFCYKCYQEYKSLNDGWEF